MSALRIEYLLNIKGNPEVSIFVETSAHWLSSENEACTGVTLEVKNACDSQALRSALRIAYFFERVELAGREN